MLDYWSNPKLKWFDHLTHCKTRLNRYSQPYNWHIECVLSWFLCNFPVSPIFWWFYPCYMIAIECHTHWTYQLTKNMIILCTNSYVSVVAYLMHVTELPWACIDRTHSVFMVDVPVTIAFPQRCSYWKINKTFKMRVSLETFDFIWILFIAFALFFSLLQLHV